MTFLDQLLIILVAITTIGICVTGYRTLRVTDAGTQIAGMVIAVTLVVEYGVRPLYIASSKTVGWDPSVITDVQTIDSSALINASGVALCSVAAFWLLFRASRPRDGSAGLRPAPSPLGPRLVVRRTSGVRTVVVVVVGAFVSALLSLQFGRVGGAFEGELGRAQFGSGYTYAFVSLAGILTVVVVAQHRAIGARLTRRTQLLLLGAFMLFAGLHFLILGGRADVLVVGIAFGILYLQPRRKISLPIIIAAAVIFTSMMATYRIATRETTYRSNQSLTLDELITEATADPIGATLRGDVSSFDKMVFLGFLEHERGWGETYIAAAGVALPGASSAEGGNRTFTRIAQPERYDAGRTYEGVSMMAEGWLNFGPLGAIVASGLTGFVYGRVWPLLRGTSARRAVGAVAIGMFPTIIRADFFNAVALAGTYAVLLVVAHVLIGRPTRARAARPETVRVA